MTIECYRQTCPYHADHGFDPEGEEEAEGPFCYEAECRFKVGAIVLVDMGSTFLRGRLCGRHTSLSRGQEWLVAAEDGDGYLVSEAYLTLVKEKT
jgi:hypothetical protein